MTALDDSALATIALTSRLIAADAEPFSPQEFWGLREIVEPAALLGIGADEIASTVTVSTVQAERIARLLDRMIGFAIALEKLEHAGIWTLTGVGDDYPERLKRLDHRRPAVLHGVGDVALLDTDGVGVISSPQPSDDGVQIADEIARRTARSGFTFISRAGQGLGSGAMNAAFSAGGAVIGVTSGPLEQMISKPSIRKGISSGRICLLTSDAPSGSLPHLDLAGHDRIIYGLSRCTIVVSCDHAQGDTWWGATEAIERGYGRVASWMGAGSTLGNEALIGKGAETLTDVAHIRELLSDSDTVSAVKPDDTHGQLPLDFDVSS